MNAKPVLATRRTFLQGAAAVAATALTCGAAEGYTFTPAMEDRYVPGAARWLMANFGEILRSRAAGTRYSHELFCAFACQESGYAWWRRSFRADRSPEDVLQMLVLDDGPGRSPARHLTETGMRADPRYATLLPQLIHAADATRAAQGDRLAPGRLRYGYGLFQYDLDNIRTDPDFWMATFPTAVPPRGSPPLGLWRNADTCADRLVRILDAKMERTGGNLDLAIRYYNGSNDNSRLYAATVRRFERIIRATRI